MRATQENHPTGGTLMQLSQECAQCGEDARCRRRDFSAQTWTVLLAWGEVEEETVDLPMCDTCYSDLREMMIDRADEVADALTHPTKTAISIKSRQVPLEKKKSAVATVSAKVKKPVGKTAKKSNKVA